MVCYRVSGRSPTYSSRIFPLSLIPRLPGYKLYPLIYLQCILVAFHILYRRQNCRHGNMYPRPLRTCIHLYMYISIDIYRRINKVARPGYLCPATCIWCKRGFRAQRNTCDDIYLLFLASKIVEYTFCKLL